jgi:hypothetical protein
MILDVIEFPTADPAGMMVLPRAPGAREIFLGTGHQQLLPLYPNYGGQLVLVTQHDEEVLSACWFGRLADEWFGELFVNRLVPIVSEENIARSEKSLSELLHELFRVVADKRLIIHIGTASVLTELQRLLTVPAALQGNYRERSVVRAALSLLVSRADLGQHSPYVLTLIPKVLALYQSAEADCATELRMSERALESAQVEFGVAQRCHAATAQELKRFEVLRRGWLKANPDLASTALAPTE